jgi:hypothetical protein
MSKKGIDHDKVKEIAKKLGMSIDLTNKIISSQFNFIRYVIEQSGFETVRFYHIGKFEVSEKRLFYLNNKNGITQNRKRTSGVRQRRGSNGEGVQETGDS